MEAGALPARSPEDQALWVPGARWRSWGQNCTLQRDHEPPARLPPRPPRPALPRVPCVSVCLACMHTCVCTLCLQTVPSVCLPSPTHPCPVLPSEAVGRRASHRMLGNIRLRGSLCAPTRLWELCLEGTEGQDLGWLHGVPRRDTSPSHSLKATSFRDRAPLQSSDSVPESPDVSISGDSTNRQLGGYVKEHVTLSPSGTSSTFSVRTCNTGVRSMPPFFVTQTDRTEMLSGPKRICKPPALTYVRLHTCAALRQEGAAGSPCPERGVSHQVAAGLWLRGCCPVPCPTAFPPSGASSWTRAWQLPGPARAPRRSCSLPLNFGRMAGPGP